MSQKETALIDDWGSTTFITSIPEKVQAACEILKLDGSNYPIWKFRIVSFIEAITGWRGYLDGDDTVCINPHADCIIQNMIENSVPNEITSKFPKCSSKSTMMAINSLFPTPNRSKQLKLWQELIQLDEDDREDISNYLRKIEQKFSDLDQAAFRWTRDSLMALAYERGLSSGFGKISTTLGSRLLSQPPQPISAKEVGDKAEQLNNVDISLSNFSRLRVTSVLPPSASSDHRDSLVSRRGFYSPTPSATSNETSQVKPHNTSYNLSMCPISNTSQLSQSPYRYLELVEMYDNTFSVEEAILGEIRGSAGTIIKVCDQDQARKTQLGVNGA